ncbi:M28 family peptidase [Tepidibacter aestuarii]|uniref:M28 family peptidase n=1 Tax=Tepidibacter aestuarii TaxID=2925782 RepID=UPI0020C0C609|nr:M28 family peptidase [Tepidibacter aestuarii]CAH2213521.1 Aminopeptidase YwaD [Tepidibacter aestuarii]
MRNALRLQKSKLLSLALILVVVMTSIGFAAPNEKSDVAFDKKVLSRVDANRVLKHIRYLSEEIGPRVAATKEERLAAEYIKDELEKYGYDPQMQEFSYDTTKGELTVDSDEIKTLASDQSAIKEEGVTAEVVDCALGNELEDFPKDVEGKIALIQRGFEYYSVKAQNAIDAGAIGVILYNKKDIVDPDAIPGTYLGEERISIPFVSISKNDGVKIRKKLAEGESVTATIITKEDLHHSQNVVAVRKPKNKNKDTNQIIYVTAHYDSVPGAPGANDNASGTAMMLEFARILKAYPIDKEVRFIACGAEEVGIIGSDYYVSQLSEDELKRSMANFNMDMISTSAEKCNILYADTVDGEQNLVTEAAIASGARLGNNILGTNAVDASDHAPFGYSNIPSACFIWGDENGDLEDWYHTPNDTIKMNISLDRLQTAGEIIGSALYDVLRTETPNLEKSIIRRADSNEVRSFGRTQ